jgi:LAO/AO transport system kinase
MKPSKPKRKRLQMGDYVAGVETGDRSVLAQAITLVESNAPAHMELSQDVITELLPLTGNSIRIGITGVPGVGKSTFIEAFGLHLCELGHSVAVLAIDPSSSISRGSILGDKTRMEELSRKPECFIRASPSGGNLGGVARKSRETMLLCEAAGFDVILIETAGVGQSETTVRSMVDFFLLLALTGAGDELQGIKRGIMELADAVVINKADGDNKMKAETTRQEYNGALHYLHPSTDGWQTIARTCSSLTGDGISEVWETIQEFSRLTEASGVMEKRRQQQTLAWMHTLLDEELHRRFFLNPKVKSLQPILENQVFKNEISVAKAVKQLLKTLPETK